MKPMSHLLRGLLALPVFLSAAHAADEVLVLSPVYAAAAADRQSYLRIVNLGSAAGKITAVVKSAQGQTLGTWTRAVAANTAPQVGMAEIEAALATKPSGEARLEITSSFYGYVQHAVWNPGGGALTNLSNCGARVVSDVHTLSNVHSTLLKGTYPSSVVIANRGAAAGSASIEVYDSGTGTKLGTYLSASIPAGGHVTIAEEAIEQQIGLTPSASQFHFTLKLTGTFQGLLAHLVDNFGAGVITDMTQRCETRGVALTALSTQDLTDRMTVAGSWTPMGKPGSQVIPFMNMVRLGTSQRTGLVMSGWNYNNSFGGAESSFASVAMVILEQKADGNVEVATSRFVSSDSTDGVGGVLVADFNGDGSDDTFMVAHNESPFVDKSSVALISKPDGTFTKIVVGDAIQGHGADLKVINGVPKVFTAGYGLASHNIYTFNGTGFSINDLHAAPQGSPNPQGGGVTMGDFLENGGLQAVYTDFPPLTAVNANAVIKMLVFGANEKPALNSTVYTLMKPYFNDKPAYASLSTLSPGVTTHNAQAFSDDLNNDGRIDLMVAASVYPGGLLPGATGGRIYPRAKLQLNINQGNGVFVDQTDTLNPDFSDLAGLDERPIFATVGGTQIIFTKAETLLLNNAVYPNGGGNRIFMNDGTGNLHRVMQDEFVAILPRLQAWLCANRGSFPNSVRQNWCSTTAIAYDQIRLLPYFTENGLLNYVLMQPYGDVPFATGGASQAESASRSIQSFALATVPLGINLFADFRKDITITDRNGSKRIRTFGGNDTINKKPSDPDATIDGGVGRDTMVYAGARANYTIAKLASGAITIKDNAAGGTTDTLINIEAARFSDTTIDLY